MRRFEIDDQLCPHCGGEIEVVLSIQAAEIVPRKSPLDDWKAQLHADDREIVETAEKSGVLAAYRQALLVATAPVNPPKNTGKKLLEFLKRMSKWNLNVRPLAKWSLENQFPGERMEVWAFGGIAAIMAEGTLRIFVPEKHLDQPQAHGGAKIKVSEMTANSSRFSDWVKCRNGYVPREAGTFFSEINKRSPGAFANLGNY